MDKWDLTNSFLSCLLTRRRCFLLFYRCSYTVSMLGETTFLMPNFLKEELSSAGANKLFSTSTMALRNSSSSRGDALCPNKDALDSCCSRERGGHPLLGTLALFLTILSHWAKCAESVTITTPTKIVLGPDPLIARDFFKYIAIYLLIFYFSPCFLAWFYLVGMPLNVPIMFTVKLTTQLGKIRGLIFHLYRKSAACVESLWHS